MINIPRVLTTCALFAVLAACAPTSPTSRVATPDEIGSLVKTTEGPLVVAHVWATWCDPCREEFPELVEVMRAHSEVEFILISADDPNEIQGVTDFLVEHQSPEGSLISTELNEAFITALSPNWQGSLPATFFYRDGELVEEWEGKRSHDVYESTIASLLK